MKTENQDIQVDKPTESEKTMESQKITTNNNNNNNNNNKEYEFNRAVLNSFENKVRLTDSDENGLELFCYVNCSSDDDNLLQQCRGVVFDGDDIVMKAFPYTIEYCHTDYCAIEENIKEDFDKCYFYDAHEGALVRMFYFKDKWYISTHRKLNAFKSKWASKESFGTCFKKCLESQLSNDEDITNRTEETLLEKFEATLDKDKQYMFLIRNSLENRIVCSSPEIPTVYHVGTFVDGELVMDVNCKIAHPEEHKFNNIDELVKHVENINICNLQGIICFAPNNKQYKINHTEYNELFKARGNEPSIKFRYLQVRMNRKFSDMLFHLYPYLATTFDEIENNIFEINKNIYNAYVQRFIKKRFVTVPAEEYNIIRECHSWHEKERITNRVTIEKIIEVFNKQNPTSINKMLRRHKLEKEQKVVEKDKVQQRKRSNTLSSPQMNEIFVPPIPPSSPLILPSSVSLLETTS